MEPVKGIINKGTLLCLALSVTLLLVFFGKLVFHANHVYFSKSGDGFQTYYTSQYHARYDSTFFRDGSMNYPYGENVFFTGCQPVVTGFIKLLRPVVDLSSYVVGITNLLMLFSLVLSAWFLFRVFSELRLPWWYAALAGTAIAYMSPQMVRMGGHFTLAYHFAIPAYLYLLLRFYREPSLRTSLYIGLLTLLMAATHMYFFVFFTIFFGLYWLVLIVHKYKGFQQPSFFLKHVFFQWLLPLLLLQLCMVIGGSANDRTHTPWGFLVFRSGLDGIFFPYGKPYEGIVKTFYQPGETEWEGLAYVGAVAVIFLLAAVGSAVYKLFKKRWRELLDISGDPLLNIFLWASIPALVFSFALPFVKMPALLDYLGFVKQFRGVGRFSWLFFYAVNLCAFYYLYQVTSKLKYAAALQTLLFLLVALDVYGTVHNMQQGYANTLSGYEDKANALPENQWLNKLDAKQYQAILPLPYFHIGSENVWFDPASPIKSIAYEVSLKTGLPLMAVSSSRTSLGQTYKSISMVLEPLEPLEILNDLPSQKPILVVVTKGLSAVEAAVAGCGDLLFKTPGYAVLKLEPKWLRSLTAALGERQLLAFANTKTFTSGDFEKTDSLGGFGLNSFDGFRCDTTFRGKGALRGTAGKFLTVFEGKLPAEGKWVYSMWMHDFKKDLYPRATIEVAVSDAGGKVYHTRYTNPHRILRMFSKSWALLEDTLQVKKGDNIKITFWNDDLKKGSPLVLDELMLRPATMDVYRQQGDEGIMKNNRYFSR